MNEKREIILHYMDLAGFVTADRDPGYATTKNGLMQTGFVITMYDELNILDEHDKSAFFDTVKSCQDEDNPGAFDRYPALDGHPRVEDPNAHDDARGVAAGSKACGFEFQRVIFEQGLKRLFYYDNTNGREPGLWAWRLRMIFDIMWYFAMNQKWAWVLFSPILMLKLYISAGRSESGEILDYMIVASMAKDSKIWRKFRALWMKKSHLIEATINYFQRFDQPPHPLIPLVERVTKI